MILIDNNNANQQIILTLTESTSIENAVYLMVLQNDATREIFRFYLPANISESIERYDLFQVDTTVFSGMDIGYYSFNIYEQEADENIEDETLLGDAIEVGKLYIVNTATVALSDQFIIYN